MSRETKFLIYCIEEYKKAKRLTGKSAFALFRKHNVIDYIITCYGALHTMGARYIVEEIDEFIALYPKPKMTWDVFFRNFEPMPEFTLEREHGHDDSVIGSRHRSQSRYQQ